jgi:hypothetical protein
MQAVASLSGVARCCVDLVPGVGTSADSDCMGNEVMRNAALGLRRIPLPRTPVNKGKSEGRAAIPRSK